MKVIDIARVCYEANRAFCIVNQEEFIPAAWEELEIPQQLGYCKGVQFRLDNPMAPAAAQHDAWMRSKVEDGWEYGPVKDEDLRQHPNLVPYLSLPMDQRLKDTIFKSVVVAMAPLHFAAKAKLDTSNTLA